MTSNTAQTPDTECAVEKVRRLGRELAHALEDFAAEAGDRYIAHVYPASAAQYPIMLENVDDDDVPWERRYHIAFPGGKAVRT